MRTPTDVCVLALEMRRDGVMASIRPMDCCFHPMDRPILPLEISLHGHFSVENWPRFAPYSGEKGPHRGVCGRALRVYASASGGSDFRLFASEGALGRKYSILRVKNERCGRFLSSSRAGCGGGTGLFHCVEHLAGCVRAIFSGTAQPVFGQAVVLRHPLAVEIAQGQVILRAGVALACSLLVEAYGLGLIFFDAQSAVVHGADQPTACV